MRLARSGQGLTPKGCPFFRWCSVNEGMTLTTHALCLLSVPFTTSPTPLAFFLLLLRFSFPASRAEAHGASGGSGHALRHRRLRALGLVEDQRHGRPGAPLARLARLACFDSRSLRLNRGADSLGSLGSGEKKSASAVPEGKKRGEPKDLGVGLLIVGLCFFGV